MAAVLGPITILVGVLALTISFLGWRAAVYERNWADARDRVLSWITECAEILEGLEADPLGALQRSETPPIRFGLRIYGYRQLVNDLNFVAGRSVVGAWGESYVNDGVLYRAAGVLQDVTIAWRAAQKLPGELGPPTTPITTSSQLRLDYGLQRLGMLDEQTRSYRLRPWYQNGIRKRQHPRYEADPRRIDKRSPLQNWIPM